MDSELHSHTIHTCTCLQGAPVGPNQADPRDSTPIVRWSRHQPPRAPPESQARERDHVIGGGRATGTARYRERGETNGGLRPARGLRSDPNTLANPRASPALRNPRIHVDCTKHFGNRKFRGKPSKRPEYAREPKGFADPSQSPNSRRGNDASRKSKSGSIRRISSGELASPRRFFLLFPSFHCCALTTNKFQTKKFLY